MFVLARALTYASLFIGLLLVFLPGQVLERSGVTRPPTFDLLSLLGMLVAVLGAALAVWCILTFAFVGKGTPAPFDPPRKLVVRGPYRFVRNPMYIGAELALAGAAIVYRSPALAGYMVLFAACMLGFVLIYEEPTLRRMFGAEYEAYCARVRRWWPRLG